jgi:hypothetical protein
VYDTHWLTPLNVLLAPTLVLPSAFPLPMANARFGLQCGWPILAGVVAVVYSCLQPKVLGPRQHAFCIRLLICFAVAFFLVWSPFDFWRFLPRLFSFVQFSYRILMLVVLFGALLAASALATAFPRGLRPGHLLAGVMVLGMFVAPYLPSHHSTDQVSVAEEVLKPNMGRCGATYIYQVAADGLLNTYQDQVAAGRTPVVTLTPLARVDVPARKRAAFFHQTSSPCAVQLPVTFYPSLQRVRDNGRRVLFGSLNSLVTLQVSAGKHVIDVEFVGLSWANYLSAATWFGLLALGCWTGLLPLCLTAFWRFRSGVQFWSGRWSWRH